MFDDADKRWVEITMCYHVFRGLKHLKETGDLPALTVGYVFIYIRPLNISEIGTRNTHVTG